MNDGVQTRRKLLYQTKLALLSHIEPSSIKEACNEEKWIKAMNEELDQIERKQTWELVPRPKDKNVIGTKWVYKNKMNEDGKVIRNKARLVCKGYAQVEGVYYEETFSLVAGLEAIRMFLAFSSYRKFKVYQMDVKSTFLNGNLEEEVYIEQLDGFQITNKRDYVCKLKKALYGLKQAPRAWYARLESYLQKQVEWMKQTLQDIKIVFEEPTIIHCDNTSMISLSKNPVQHSKSKHIPIKYHYLRDQAENKNIKLEYVPTQEQVADIFTKPLNRDIFEYLRQKLGVILLPT
jgi:hypothetical protein